MPHPPGYDPMTMARSQSAAQPMGVPGPSQAGFSFGQPPPGWQGFHAAPPYASHPQQPNVFVTAGGMMVPERGIGGHGQGMMYPVPGGVSFGGGPANNHGARKWTLVPVDR